MYEGVAMDRQEPIEQLNDFVNKQRNELWKKYFAEEKRVEKARTKRAIATVVFFTAVYFLLFYTIEKPTGIGFVVYVIMSIFFAGIHFWVNVTIFGQLVKMGESEQRILDGIKKRIDKLDQNTP